MGSRSLQSIGQSVDNKADRQQDLSLLNLYLGWLPVEQPVNAVKPAKEMAAILANLLIFSLSCIHIYKHKLIT